MVIKKRRKKTPTTPTPDIRQKLAIFSPICICNLQLIFIRLARVLLSYAARRRRRNRILLFSIVFHPLRLRPSPLMEIVSVDVLRHSSTDVVSNMMLRYIFSDPPHPIARLFIVI